MDEILLPLALQVPAPAGWAWEQKYTLRSAEADCNLIVTAELVAENVSLGAYVSANRELQETTFEGYQEIRAEERPVFGGRPGYMLIFRWSVEEGVTVVQVQHYCVVGTVAVTATATFKADNEARLGPQVVTLMDRMLLPS